MDNLGEVTNEYDYAGNDVNEATLGDSDGVPNQPAANLLRSETTSQYNLQGVEYGSDEDPVDQTTGGSDGLAAEDSNTLYDVDGNQTGSIDPSGRITATTYDDLGQDIADYEGQVHSVLARRGPLTSSR